MMLHLCCCTLHKVISGKVDERLFEKKSSCLTKLLHNRVDQAGTNLVPLLLIDVQPVVAVITALEVHWNEWRAAIMLDNFYMTTSQFSCNILSNFVLSHSFYNVLIPTQV